MSFNFGNSLSGYGGGNSLGNLQGSYNFAPTYNAPNGLTSITPSFGRTGNVGSFSTNSGVNTYGATVSHQFTLSTSGFVGGSTSSNGHSSVGAGINIKF